jgi:hypothetical protein
LAININKKIIIVIVGTGIIASSFVFFINLNSIDYDNLEQTFEISATYFENNSYAEIKFHDKSGKTKYVILEILGMPESFHKEYDAQQFKERIAFTAPPKYGWHSVPVTFFINHENYGNVGIKTEIRPVGEIPAKIIFSKGL